MNKPAPILRRLAALLYESLLIGSVTMLSGFIAGVIDTQILLRMPTAFRFTVPLTSIILLISWWYYFKINWHLEGQTLPMRTWKIGLIDCSGSRPKVPRLMLRFIWATIFIVFIPLMAYAALQHMGIHGKTAALAAICWWILPWGYALLNSRQQFLYDRLAGTELIDLREIP